MSAAATAAEVAEVIAQRATGALAADGVLVYELDKDRDQLRLLAHAGLPEEIIGEGAWFRQDFRVRDRRTRLG